MRTKICGITTRTDAQLAIEYGAWALGFNFYAQSPRFIDLGQAKALITTLPKSILTIGVLINLDEVNVHDLLKVVDFLQVYEEVDAPLSIKRRMILSLNHDVPDEAVLNQYAYILVDAPKMTDGCLGGTGRLSDWTLARRLSQTHRVILAGGLTPDNVRMAIETVHPFAVDVASGVQESPGRLNHVLVKQFLSEVNDA